MEPNTPTTTRRTDSGDHDTDHEGAHYQLYRDARGEWRWRLLGPDGAEIEADSGEGFATAERALQSLSLVQTYAGQTPVDVRAPIPRAARRQAFLDRVSVPMRRGGADGD